MRKKYLFRKLLQIKIFRFTKFEKLIPKELKINQTCIQNACLLKNNTMSLKKLVKKYKLDLDETCLNNAIDIEMNRSTIAFMIEQDVNLTEEQLRLMMNNQRLDKLSRTLLISFWNKINNTQDVEGVEEI